MLQCLSEKKAKVANKNRQIRQMWNLALWTETFRASIFLIEWKIVFRYQNFHSKMLWQRYPQS